MLLQIHEPGQTPDPHSTGVATPKQGLAIGIDLGTTHSVAAIMEVGVGSGNADNMADNNTINPGNPGNPGTVRVLATDAAARSPSLMPSVVAYGRDGQVAAVGTAALRLLGQGDYTVIRSVKRLMDCHFHVTIQAKTNLSEQNPNWSVPVCVPPLSAQNIRSCLWVADR
jgi:molecular chaperone DnaK (HSP70)